MKQAILREDDTFMDMYVGNPLVFLLFSFALIFQRVAEGIRHHKAAHATECPDCGNPSLETARRLAWKAYTEPILYFFWHTRHCPICGRVVHRYIEQGHPTADEFAEMAHR